MAQVVLDEPSSQFSLNVRDELVLRAPVTHPSGSVADITLHFFGATATLEAAFIGEVFAPVGTIILGSHAPREYRGTFSASTLEVRPDVTLICE